jgi:hypothetical protein
VRRAYNGTAAGYKRSAWRGVFFPLIRALAAVRVRVAKRWEDRMVAFTFKLELADGEAG